MKRHLLIWLGLAAALIVQAALPAVPDLGNPSIVVLANNLQNYYYNYAESSRPSYNDDEGRAEKTRKIADMIIASNADIFAFCEIEAKPVILDYLVETLNGRLEAEVCAAVSDGINVTTDQYDNALRSGFIYRIATVAPYGSNYAASTVAYYKNVMRIQAWTELATGERFTLSMSHFKAKSDDASKEQRVKNANWLMNSLSGSAKVKDPDILLMGDFNAQMDEECISVILNRGYEEQLLRFDPAAYSYVYQTNRELIDHAFANSTMAGQITGAAVWHTNTSAGYSARYSDHDAVMVGLCLGGLCTTPIEKVTATEPNVQKILRSGQIVIIRSGVEYTVTGQRIR